MIPLTSWRRSPPVLFLHSWSNVYNLSHNTRKCLDHVMLFMRDFRYRNVAESLENTSCLSNTSGLQLAVIFADSFILFLSSVRGKDWTFNQLTVGQFLIDWFMLNLLSVLIKFPIDCIPVRLSRSRLTLKQWSFPGWSFNQQPCSLVPPKIWNFCDVLRMRPQPATPRGP